jgi:hypothetical protein
VDGLAGERPAVGRGVVGRSWAAVILDVRERFEVGNGDGEGENYTADEGKWGKGEEMT